MSYRNLRLLLFTLMMTSSVVAASPMRHSGRTVAVDPAKHSLTREEIGRWTPQHTTAVKRSIEISPSTAFELVKRAKTSGVGSGYAGFTTSALGSSEVKPGDFATVADAPAWLRGQREDPARVLLSRTSARARTRCHTVARNWRMHWPTHSSQSISDERPFHAIAEMREVGRASEKIPVATGLVSHGSRPSPTSTWTSIRV